MTAPPPRRPAPSGSKRRVPLWAWLAPLLAVVVVGIALLVLGLAGGFGGRTATGPADVVARFATALNTSDCDGLFATTTAAGRRSLGIGSQTVAECEQQVTPTPVPYTAAVSDLQQTGDQASGALTGTRDGAAYAFSIALVRQGGAWLVDGATLTVRGDAPGPVRTP